MQPQPCNPESRQKGPLGPTACGEEAVRSGQGRHETQPLLPASSQADCYSAGMPGTELEAGVGCLGGPPAPRPPLPVLPLQPLSWGVFHVLLAWTGVGWTWAGTTREKCPFGGDRRLRWGSLGRGEREERRRKAGMKGQNSRAKCGSSLVPVSPEGLPTLLSHHPKRLCGACELKAKKKSNFLCPRGFRPERSNERGDIPFPEGQKQREGWDGSVGERVSLGPSLAAAEF